MLRLAPSAACPVDEAPNALATLTLTSDVSVTLVVSELTLSVPIAPVIALDSVAEVVSSAVPAAPSIVVAAVEIATLSVEEPVLVEISLAPALAESVELSPTVAVSSDDESIATDCVIVALSVTIVSLVEPIEVPPTVEEPIVILLLLRDD